MPDVKLTSLAITALWLFSACSAEPDASSGNLVERGQHLATMRCSSCHAIDQTGISPELQAPPLRQALLDYDIEALGLDFEAHLSSGTDIMPAFDLSGDERDALMAFILSLE